MSRSRVSRCSRAEQEPSVEDDGGCSDDEDDDNDGQQRVEAAAMAASEQRRADVEREHAPQKSGLVQGFVCQVCGWFHPFFHVRSTFLKCLIEVSHRMGVEGRLA